jgi:hypothetical protein
MVQPWDEVVQERANSLDAISLLSAEEFDLQYPMAKFIDIVNLRHMLGYINKAAKVVFTDKKRVVKYTTTFWGGKMSDVRKSPSTARAAATSTSWRTWRTGRPKKHEGTDVGTAAFQRTSAASAGWKPSAHGPEKIFSCAGLYVTALRNNYSVHTLEMMVFLKKVKKYLPDVAAVVAMLKANAKARRAAASQARRAVAAVALRFPPLLLFPPRRQITAVTLRKTTSCCLRAARKTTSCCWTRWNPSSKTSATSETAAKKPTRAKTVFLPTSASSRVQTERLISTTSGCNNTSSKNRQRSGLFYCVLLCARPSLFLFRDCSINYGLYYSITRSY